MPPKPDYAMPAPGATKPGNSWRRASTRQPPGMPEKASRAASTSGGFEAVAREWRAAIHVHKVSDGHAARTLIRLEQDVFPWIGPLPVAQVAAQTLLQALRRIE